MKYVHKFKHEAPRIDPINPYVPTGYVSWKVNIRGEQYGQVREYRKHEECLLPEILRMMVESKNEVCNAAMAMTDEEFKEHVRKSQERAIF